jgi:HlyD family secretion protein
MALVRRVPPRPAALFVGCALILPLTAASCGDKPSAVAVGAASRSTVTEIVEAPGAVTARSAATLTAPADGTLAALRVKPGEKVRKGQVVAVIDSPATERRRADAQKAVRQAGRTGVSTGGGGDVAAAQRSTDAEAHTAFATARAAAGKLTDPAVRNALLTQVTAAEQRYAAASRAVAAATRSVQRGVASLGTAMNALSSAQRLQAQQAYDLADAAVQALTLRAPVAGVVQLGGTAAGAGSPSLTDLIAAGSSSGGGSGAASARGTSLPGVDPAPPQGAVVTAGTPIMTIVDTGQLGLTADVDETDVLLVKPGIRARVELDAVPDASYDATVRAVDLSPTTSSRGGVSYRVRLTLGPGRDATGTPAPAPRPGMSAVAHLQVRTAHDAVAVRASAVVRVGSRNAVWVVRGGTARQRLVTVGTQGEDLVAITEGIRPGERVVVTGAERVHAGQKLP